MLGRTDKARSKAALAEVAARRCSVTLAVGVASAFDPALGFASDHIAELYARDVRKAVSVATIADGVELVHLAHAEQKSVTLRVGVLNESADMFLERGATRAWAWGLMPQSPARKDGEPIAAELEDDDLELECEAGELYAACTVDVIPRELAKAADILGRMLLGSSPHVRTAELARTRLATAMHTTTASAANDLNGMLFARPSGLARDPVLIGTALDALRSYDLEAYRVELAQPLPWFIVATGPITVEQLRVSLAAPLAGLRYRKPRPRVPPASRTATRANVTNNEDSASSLAWAWISQARRDLTTADAAADLVLLRLIRDELAGDSRAWVALSSYPFGYDARGDVRAWVTLSSHPFGYIEGRARTNAPRSLIDVLSSVQASLLAKPPSASTLARTAAMAAEEFVERLDDPHAAVDLIAETIAQHGRGDALAEMLAALAVVSPQAVQRRALELLHQPCLAVRVGSDATFTHADAEVFTRSTPRRRQP